MFQLKTTCCLAFLVLSLHSISQEHKEDINFKSTYHDSIQTNIAKVLFTGTLF